MLKLVVNNGSSRSVPLIQLNVQSNYYIVQVDGKQRLINKNDINFNNDVELEKVEDYINHIIEKIEIVPGNLEKTTEKLFKTLEEENVIPKGTVYNSRGIKTIQRDLERLGNNFDYRM